jgi:hypothetical protein
MKIVEKTVSAGDCDIFDLDEFLSRTLYAHLAHSSEVGPRESPVWFHWDGQSIWIIGGSTFPTNLKREPRCALGIVDWDPPTGLSQHVGIRGKAEVLPFDSAMARTIFRRYFGPDESDWDSRFDDVFTGESGLEMVRIIPESVVMRDQSYKPTRHAQARRSG